ncbi:hypothetical protein GUITHDRAFT_154370 [Guillardia theta CCMP2712]|uniref:Uncharacterized protein n=1 Tax=Guillardia theta (strain CCMP2712) TaxID=905079 RepID=L1IUG3_GUITC|nr:hypothetical protein GUITHDRAFT_154370 [Guillardia theta CCMP2712]EKX39539.1 hypothetical protein GUITHDRAFT_154370 [Guillardia theta CCMP2712]|eukprot:XP_005826519.1 hypothetical protein GUITHDRAFT_154370 [Guillardia theta CCMP2712]
MFAVLSHFSMLIDCPSGTMPDPTHYPSSRCVLPSVAKMLQGTGGSDSASGF